MEKTLAELIREYKGGNEKSFEKIAEKMNPMIMFYAGKLLNGCCFTEKTTKSWHVMKASADNIVIKSGKKL